MAEYVNPPIEVDPTSLEQQAYDYLAAQIPGWEPAAGNLDVWLIQAFAQVAAQVAEVASDVPLAIFRYYGANVAGIPPRDAAPAVGTVTVTAVDQSGYVVRAGDTIAVESPTGELVAFEFTQDWEIPSGEQSVSGVPVVAVEPGAHTSGLSGTAVLLDPVDWIDSVTFDAPTTGGADAEPDEEYLDRLVEELRLLTPRPILPRDFETLARRVPGVGRVTALDGYNPADGSTGNARMITLAVTNDAGLPVSETTKAQLRALMEAEREVTFIVHVIDPTYTTVDVDFRVAVWPDFDPATVVENATAAVAEYLNPATWGQPNYGDTQRWVHKSDIPSVEVAHVILGVEGVRHIESLELNGQAWGSVSLPGAAPLPQVGDITGEAA